MGYYIYTEWTIFFFFFFVFVVFPTDDGDPLSEGVTSGPSLADQLALSGGQPQK